MTNLQESKSGSLLGSPWEWRPYFAMMKPTISLLVLFTTAPCLLLAQTAPSLTTFLATCIGTFLAAGAAGIFNHLVDADIDQVMERTQKRPLPAQLVSGPAAGLLATTLTIFSFLLLYHLASPAAAVVALLANAFYVGVYSIYLKPRTPQNIVIGGAAGAVGPIIGCLAVQPTVSPTALLLFLIIFLWTPPHFWALALKYKKDYAQANIPMYPVVHGDHATRFWMMIYSFSLLPAILGVFYLNPSLVVFALTSIPATLYFIFLAVQLYRQASNEKTMRLFFYSCGYLFIIFTGIAIDRAIFFF